MRYKFNLITEHSIDSQMIGEEALSSYSPLIVFTLNSPEKYPVLMIEGIDVITLLNNAKKQLFSLGSKQHTSWKYVANQTEESLTYVSKSSQLENSSVASAQILPWDNTKLWGGSQSIFSINEFLNKVKEHVTLKDYMNSAIYNVKHYINKLHNSYRYTLFLKEVNEVVNSMLINEEKKQKILYFLEANLHQCVQKLIHFEEKILETPYAQKQYSLFKKMYKGIFPYLDSLYNQTSNSYLRRYCFEFSDDNEIYDEKRKSLKNFIPSGMCYYNQKVFINTKVVDNNKVGRDWQNFALHHIVWHELGHAIDFPYEMKDVFKSNINNEFKKNKIMSLTKRNYKKSLLLKKKDKEKIDYYTAPSFSYDKETLYDWERSRTETIAESMSFLMKWLNYGFGKEDYLVLHGDIVTRKLLQILSETMLYLLKEIDWTYLGIHHQLIIKRKIQIKNYLKKIGSDYLSQNIPQKKTSLSIKPLRHF